MITVVVVVEANALLTTIEVVNTVTSGNDTDVSEEAKAGAGGGGGGGGDII